jgi:hypothetical protein
MKWKLLFSVLAVLAISLFFACDSNNKVGDPPCDSCDPNNPIDPVDPNNPNQNTGPYGILASNIDLGKIRTMYDMWISIYYVEYENDDLKGGNPKPEAAGTARIRAAYNNSSDGSKTCSEAIGYGMILTSLMEDYEKLDKLFAYSKLFRYTGINLMRWDVTGFSQASSGGPATDADIDILAALIIAYRKTNNSKYLEEAIEIGKSLYEEAIGSTGLLLPGRSADNGLFIRGEHFYNISYMSLAPIKALAEYDKDGGRDWNSILNNTLSYMENVQSKGKGLWPDWSSEDGNPINPCNGSNQCLLANGQTGTPGTQGRCTRTNNECDGTLNSYESYYKETPRIPWRIAWYYRWYGDNKAKAMLDKGMDFMKEKGISESNLSSIREYYSYQDDRQGDRSNSRIIHSLCALGMGSSSNQSWMNSCNDEVFKNYNNDDILNIHVSNYYNKSLQLIYAMLFNGKF